MRRIVRLWVYWRGWVKLTLRRDEPLYLSRREATDEGYDAHEARYCLETDAHGVDVVTLRAHDEGRDCDGRTEHDATLACRVKYLRACSPCLRYLNKLERVEVAVADVRLPAWRVAREMRRDYAAEAAGY